jgi:hypothetical protein
MPCPDKFSQKHAVLHAAVTPYLQGNINSRLHSQAIDPEFAFEYEQ